MSDSDSEFSAKDPSDPSLSELSELSDSEPDAPYERGMDVDIPLPPPALPQQTVKRRTQAGVLSNLKERENVQLSAGAAEQQHDLATILAKAIDTYIHSHQLQHSEPFVLAPPTPKKGRPKKGHAAASKDKTAKIEQDRPCSKTAAGILVEILDGKMVCPVKSCPKSFGSGPGLKYHLANTKHDVNEFLEAVYKDDTTTFELVKQQVGSMNQGWAIVLDEYPVTVPKSGSTCPMFELSKRRSAHSAKAGQPSVIGKHFRGTKMANLDEFPKREMLIARDDEPDDISSSVIEFNDSHFELIDDLRAAMHLPADFQLEIDTVARSKASMSIDNLCSAAHPSLQNTWFLNAGGPVWALEWCPSIDEQGAQYLAVGCFKTMDKQLILGQRVSSTDQESKKDSLQVWRVPKDAKPELAYCIVHDYGPCVAFKWHPDDQGTASRLGILAASFGDGSLHVMNLPKPSRIQAVQSPFYLNVKASLCSTMLDSGVLMSLAWNGSKIIAGSSNGFMACWNVEKCLLSANADPILIFHSRVHDSCIRIVQLIGTDKAPLIASGGSDGRVMLTDPTSPWSPYQFSRSRGFVTGLASNHNGGYFFTESDPVGRIRYQSAELMGYKLVGNHESNISSLDFSMYMPFLLSTGAEGSVKIRNSNRSETPKRDKHCVQIELFSVQSKNNRMVFSEHNKKQSVNNSAGAAIVLVDGMCGVHKGVFSQRIETGGVIATGGMGWVRIQSLLD